MSETIRKGLESVVVLLTDMQDGYVRLLSPETRKRVIQHQLATIELCAERDVPVIALEMNVLAYGHTLPVLRQALYEVRRSMVLVKPKPDGFYGTDLADLVDAMEADTAFLMGLYASACVRSTGRGALDAGLQIVTSPNVIADKATHEGSSLWWYERNGRVVESIHDLLPSATISVAGKPPQPTLLRI